MRAKLIKSLIVASSTILLPNSVTIAANYSNQETIPQFIYEQEDKDIAKNNQIALKLISYLSDIKSIAAEFEQTDLRGSKAKGMLIIDKPHKFRCNYYAPFPLLIVGNKNYVSVYDYEMEHFSRISASDNLFNFMLIDQTNFKKEFEVISAEEYKELGNDIIEVMVYHNNSGRRSKILFDQGKKQLTEIMIFEDDNEITVKFEPSRKITKASPKLFILQDPEKFGIPPKFDKKALDNMMNFAN